MVTEFGCCGYAGAAARGGLGWAIIDEGADPPALDGDYVRDESEQVACLREFTEIFQAEGVDLAFWFTFAGYHLVRDPDPHHDLDLASYGVVSMVPGGPGSGYQGLAGSPGSRSGRWPGRTGARQPRSPRRGSPGPLPAVSDRLVW